MKIKISTLIFFWTALLLIGCTTEKAVKDIRVIDLENNVGKSKSINLSEIAESIDYIPLETTEESILGVILKSRLKLEDNIIVIQCVKRNALKVFQRDGKYIDSLNKVGNGPDEVMTINGFEISPEKEIFSLYGYQELVEYDKHGNVVRKIDPSKTKKYCENLSGFTKLTDNYYVFQATIHDSVRNSSYSIFVLDTLSEIVLKTLYPKEEVDFINSISITDNYSPGPNMFKYKNKVRVINGYDPYIISINKDLTIDTAYVINFGKYSRKKFPGGKSSVNFPCLELIPGIFESSSFLFMCFRTGSLPIKKYEILSRNGEKREIPLAYSIFDKRTGLFTFIEPCGLNEFGLIEDFEGGPAFWPLYISQDDYMVSIIEAHKFIQYAQNHKVSDKFKKIADSLKEDDNPVVVLVKLKK